jgi:hypothetical protein
VPLHPQKCRAWCTVSATGIVGPLFFTDTVTTEHYKQVLENNFIPFLQGTDVSMRKCSSNRMEIDHTQQIKFWIYFISILVTVSFTITSLNVLAMDGLGHHILLTSTLMITFYGGI